MKLETEFVKLPLQFDVERLRKEISRFSDEDWMAHTTGFAGNSSIPLISLKGEYNDAMHGPMQPTPALDRCEYIQQIMTMFGEVFSRSRLMRLGPGHEVPLHVDINYHWFNRVRIHLPITTTEDVLFYCGDKHVHMVAGEAWIFNSWEEHTVRNGSDETRVHLVLDTAGSPRFWDLVERGDWPFKNRKRLPDEPRFFSYESGRQTNVRTEAYNVPLVQSPGELEALIKGLVDETDCSNESEEESRRAFVEFTQNFVWAWREVWSEFGMKPGGWPRYHRLVNQADNAVFSIAPGLLLRNGVDVDQAFRSLVLSSAVNEEFAPLYLDKDEVPAALQETTRRFSAEQNQSDGSEYSRQASRNAPCPCGSGKRYKRCHGQIESA